MYAGVLLGGWYGGWAADHTGWRQGFTIAAAIGLSYSFVLWYGVRTSAVNAATPITRSDSSISELTRSPRFLALSLAFAAFCAIQWVVLAWYPSFLQERFHLSMTDSGWNATAFVQISQLVGIFAGSTLADHFRKRFPPARLYVAAAGVLLSAPFAYWTFASLSLNEARFFSAGFGLFSGLLASNAFAAAYDVIGSQNRGLGGGVLNMMGGLSSAVMIYMAGIWKLTIGLDGVVLRLMAVSLVSAILLAVIATKEKDQPKLVSFQ